MAIKQTNIFPLDKQPRKAVGVAYPFSAFAVSGSSTPFKINYTTKDQINSNLAVFFYTSPGERPLNPDYGGGLKNILFDQLTDNTYETVRQVVKNSLFTHFPEVNLEKLEVFGDPDGLTLKVIMSYTVFNENDNLELNFSA